MSSYAGRGYLYGEVLYMGGCTVRSNTSWVMVTWDPCAQTDMTESITFPQLHKTIKVVVKCSSHARWVIHVMLELDRLNH